MLTFYKCVLHAVKFMISEFTNCKVSVSGGHWVNALRDVRMVLMRLGSGIMQ